MTGTTAFGPQGPNYSTTRPPADPKASAGADTWFKNCSAAGAKDGTFATADFFNVLIGNLRYLCREAGVGLDDADDTMVYNAILSLVNDANFIVPQILNSNITLYVNPAIGSDTNDGTANSAGHALKTIQKAVDKAFSYISGQYTVTINLADGLYTAGFTTPYRPGPLLNIVGNVATPANVLIDLATNGGACEVQGPNVCNISGVKVQTPTGNGNNHGFSAYNGASMTTSNTESGALGGVVFAAAQATLYAGTHKFTGNCAGFFYGGADGLVGRAAGAVFTVSGAVTVSVASVHVRKGGVVHIGTPQATWVVSGSVTGQRYNCATNGIVDVEGAGANYFPGTIAGALATGGQYV